MTARLLNLTLEALSPYSIQEKDSELFLLDKKLLFAHSSFLLVQ
jgi:hypothetical protein